MTPKPARKPSRQPRNEDRPHAGKARDSRASVVEESAETADSGRDLVHGEGGAINLLAEPGDLSKDD
ncbi:hypothetical protein [Bradyrhizobium guangxiense]|uniref:hypothetical protein n=1 Tax=Bradyrhizobium guangxiense TaxID=1325115 RepID=UPI001008C834|nr:hypothetical protein [Bradyrhizobium guangxiense]